MSRKPIKHRCMFVQSPGSEGKVLYICTCACARRGDAPQVFEEEELPKGAIICS